MVNPKLVVLSGLPGSGKSIIAEKLVRDYGFVRLSTDKFRNELYGKNYGDLQNEPQGKLKEDTMRSLIDFAKISYLEKGLNIVIDSSAPIEEIRRRFMSTSGLDKLVDKYLVFLDTERPLLEKRYLKKGGSKEILEFFDEFWETPTGAPEGGTFITIKNNPQTDLSELYRALEQIIGRE